MWTRCDLPKNCFTYFWFDVQALSERKGQYLWLSLILRWDQNSMLIVAWDLVILLWVLTIVSKVVWGRADRPVLSQSWAGARLHEDPSRGDLAGEQRGVWVCGQWRSLRCPLTGSGRWWLVCEEEEHCPQSSALLGWTQHCRTPDSHTAPNISPW